MANVAECTIQLWLRYEQFLVRYCAAKSFIPKRLDHVIHIIIGTICEEPTGRIHGYCGRESSLQISTSLSVHVTNKLKREFTPSADVRYLAH